MAIRMIEMEVDGHKWTCNTLPASKGWSASMQFLDIVAQPLVQMVAQQGESVQSEAFSTALGIFTSKLSDPRSLDLVKGLTSDLRKDGKPVNFDMEFAANYGLLLRIFVRLAKENFQSFLDENGTSAGQELVGMVSA